MKKYNVLLTAVGAFLMLTATVYASPPMMSFTQSSVGATSSAGAAGMTGLQHPFVTAGASDISTATALKCGNTVLTNANSSGVAYTNSPTNAVAGFAGGATATITSEKIGFGK